MKNRFVTDKDSVLSFCELAPCFKKLQVIVNTFIHPIYHFSWIISYAELPDFEKVEIQEFLLEPIPDPDAPEPILEECDTLGPEPIEPVSVLTPSSYEPEALAEVQRRERKMRELEAEIAQRKIKELETQLEDLKSRHVSQIIEPIISEPIVTEEA
jgi:hypothetical protein